MFNITIEYLIDCLRDCVEGDRWFEIDGDSAKILYEYIKNLEKPKMTNEARKELAQKIMNKWHYRMNEVAMQSTSSEYLERLKKHSRFTQEMTNEVITILEEELKRMNL